MVSLHRIAFMIMYRFVIQNVSDLISRILNSFKGFLDCKFEIFHVNGKFLMKIFNLLQFKNNRHLTIDN